MVAERESLLLQELEGAFSLCEGATITRSPTGITVAASDSRGFDMALLMSNGLFILTFDRWEETFDDFNAARSLLEAALMGEARLHIDTLSGRPWRWTLERRSGAGEWIAESTITRPVWRLWGRPGVVRLQNAFGAGQRAS